MVPIPTRSARFLSSILVVLAIPLFAFSPARVSHAASPDSVLIGSYPFDDGSGAADPMGWTTVDFTDRGGPFFHIDNLAGLGGGLTPLAGTKSLWCGARPSTELCSYATLPGYARAWDESFVSVPLAVTGTVNISFLARFDTEPSYDFAYLDYYTKSNRWHTIASYTGSSSTSILESIPPDSLQGSVRIRLRFASDGAYDDGDGQFDSDGAVLIDNLVVTDANGTVDTQNFESETVGALGTVDGDWSAVATPPLGNYAALFDGDDLVQEDPVIFNHSKVWGFFNGSPYNYGCGGHPEQPVMPLFIMIDNGLVSPAIDLAPFFVGGGLPPAAGIFIEFDAYLDLFPVFPPSETVKHTIELRSKVGNCWGAWNDVEEYGGGTGEWYRKQFDLRPHIAAGADQIQIAFREFNYVEHACRSHAPLIDNVLIFATGVPTDIAGRPRTAGFSLDQNYPNPFNPLTRIDYEVPSPGARVSLRIHDVAGRLVRTLDDGFVTAGVHIATWNGRNDRGEPVGSGVYFYRLTAPGVEYTRKMVLLK